MSVVAVGLVERFFHLKATTLELDLHERQAIHQQSHVIAVRVLARHGDLMRHLVLVLAPMNLIDQLNIARCAVILVIIQPISQYFGPLKDISLAQLVQDLAELSLRINGVIVPL